MVYVDIVIDLRIVSVVLLGSLRMLPRLSCYVMAMRLSRETNSSFSLMSFRTRYGSVDWPDFFGGCVSLGVSKMQTALNI